MILRWSNNDKTHHLHIKPGRHHHGDDQGELTGRWHWVSYEVRGNPYPNETVDEIPRFVSSHPQGFDSYEAAQSDAEDILASIGAKWEEVHDG